MKPSILTVHLDHLLYYRLGQMAPNSLSWNLFSLDLNDIRLGVPTNCEFKDLKLKIPHITN